MSKIAPDSVIELFKNIDISDGQEIAFSSAAKQSAYFEKHKVASSVNCSYVRRNGTLKIEYPTSVVSQCNFIAFRNSAFENKVFFAWIYDYNYINNVTTEVNYEIDWFQTEMFNAQYNPCLIDREQMSESDYNDMVANPYSRNVLEMVTAEDIVVNKEMEINYPYHSYANGDTSPIKETRLCLPTSTTDDNKVITMYLSSFDYSAIGEETVIQFLSLFDYLGTSNETIDPQRPLSPTIIPSVFGQWENGFARPYAMLGVDTTLQHGSTGTAVESAMRQISLAVNWLTAQNLSQNIIGLYVLPKWMFTSKYDNSLGDIPTDSRTLTITPAKYNAKSPKLETSPFKYIRVISASGDIKEYQFEHFVDMANGSPSCKLRLLSNSNGLPTASVLPYRYKYALKKDTTSVIPYRYGDDLNYYERIDIQNFPQCGYSTDAYLTFLSSQYQQVVGSSTARTVRDLQTSVVTSSVGAVGSIVDSGVGLASGNTASAGTFTGPISSTFNALTVAGQYSLYNNVMNEASAMKNIGPSGVSLVEKGDAISTAYDVAKPAYVADIYHAGSSGGYLPYQFIGTPGYFTIEVATLKDTYVKQIDNYFTCYGYKSGRFGVPRVCNFVKGASNTPHFEEWDGAPITYVKTNNMSVTHSNNIVVSYIERLFNLGCRFLNGDEL